ncbi:mobilization protein [Mucilaginibacter paludis]|uniref:Mobilization protein n=1 Tax=Mucilaginibacter paludis DSM 18603 TaxID=714943 RepID=H1YHA4_9SPHI|nr:mobilization protein [Mucilaginibacter paludis]EHQ24606.1 mobilization protein [Mucilaginibacter paludis DSM 18603]
MPRKKAADHEELFIVPVRTRVTKATAERLEKLRTFSDCRSIGELARRILSGGTITVFHKDASMDGVMEQLVLIRRELKAIGINMNQVTKSYHQSRDENTKAFYALKLAAQYQEAATRIALLLSLISQLSKKWLAK